MNPVEERPLPSPMIYTLVFIKGKPPLPRGRLMRSQ